MRLRTRTDARRLDAGGLFSWLNRICRYSPTASDGGDCSRRRRRHYINKQEIQKHAITSRLERHSPLVSRGDAGCRCYLLSPPRVPLPRCLCLGSISCRRGHHCHEQVSAFCVRKSSYSHTQSQSGRRWVERRTAFLQPLLPRSWSSNWTSLPSRSTRSCSRVVVLFEVVDTGCYTRLLRR